MSIKRRELIKPQVQNFLKITDTQIGEGLIQTVDARTLWQWLRSKQQFGNWIKIRIEEGRFIKNRDFVTVNKKNKVNNQQVTTTVGDQIDYHITLDCNDCHNNL